jgi:hypothetical protein
VERFPDCAVDMVSKLCLRSQGATWTSEAIFRGGPVSRQDLAKKPDLADFPRSRRDIQRMQVSTEIDYQIYTSTNALFEIENFNSEICPE